MTRSPKRGIVSLFTAAAFYGLYGVFSRLIGSAFGNFNQNWIKNLIVLTLITLVIFVNKTKLISPKKKDFKWIILWFLSGSWVTVLTFIAFNNLPIGTTYLIIYSAMITAGFISGEIFFNEKLNRLKIVSLIFAMAGLFIIYRFTLTGNQVFYLVLSLISGFMTGIWNTISKKFSDNYPNNQMVFMDAISSITAAYIGSLIFQEHLPNNIQSISWLWISIYAVVQTINVGLIVYGFKNIEAQIGSIILPIEIIFATLFSYLIFKEVPTPLTVLGGFLIIFAAVVPSLNVLKQKNNHKNFQRPRK